MKKKIEIEIDEFTGLAEINSQDRELVEEAMEASKDSYSPYSNFRVGAAVRLKSGKISKSRRL